MNAVIFDLELVKRFKVGQPSEIVEIGACKVNLSTKQMIDQFQLYISPKHGYISKSTRKFINMKKEDMKNTVPFHQGIEQFTEWLGNEYYLCSWGKDDKAHLINQCVRNRIELEWLKNYNDIQKQIGKIISAEHTQLGLKNALQLAGIEPVGKAHRGIDDAINTAELFIKYIDSITLNENILSKKEISKQYVKIKKMRSLQRSEAQKRRNEK
ncbi:exonuclease domain-containing protein [Anaerobacillus sp. MEB173]|uniref:exonuclease domain-containing protein n=1 Tax=Anaerobacillus sp. MEB173 TaxID=3383345 RepID=UPI003F8F2DEC